MYAEPAVAYTSGGGGFDFSEIGGGGGNVGAGGWGGVGGGGEGLPGTNSQKSDL